MTWLSSWMETRARKEGPYSVSDAGVTSFLGLNAFQSAAGVDVNETIALNCTAVFACVRVNAESIASMPLILYRRDGEGRERDYGHPLYDLLRVQPNEEMTAMVWRETMMAHIQLWGNHYSWIDRDRSGNVRAIWPLHPSRMAVERSRQGSELIYRYEAEEDERAPRGVLRASEVLHIPGLTMNGVVGISVIGANRDTIGLSMAATRYGGAFFGHGARPGGIIKSDKPLSDAAKQKIKETWNADHQGEKGWQKVGLLDGNLQWQDINISQKDAEFLGQRRFQTEEIARMYRVPLVLLQMVEKGAVYGEGVEQLMLSYATYTLQPYEVRIEQEIQRKLLVGEERKQYFVEHLTDSLLRSAFETRMRGYVQGRSWGMLSINDVLRKENMAPITETWGDDRIVPANYVKAADVGKTINAPAPAPVSDSGGGDSSANKSARELFVPLLSRVLADVFDREIGAVRKGAENRTADDLLPWLDDYYKTTYRRILSERCEPVLEAMARADGRGESATEWAAIRTEGIVSYSLTALQSAVRAAMDRQLPEREAVAGVLSDWTGGKLGRMLGMLFEEVGDE